MKDILSEIVAHKRLEVEEQKRQLPADELRRRIAAQPDRPCRSMKASLASKPLGIIAEFKRRSPSKGWIHQDARPEEVAPAYAAAGAAALSVLTDEAYFGGTLDDIVRIRPLVDIPILRKEFIIDPYQLQQARAVGADAVLLIAACLTPDECASLTAEAHALGLEVLLEMHSVEELAYVQAGPDMVGINNRHLGSFVTDVATSFQLAEALRATLQQAVAGEASLPLMVSESGLSSLDTLQRLQAAGFQGFLMGEAFMKHPHPGEALKTLLQSCQKEEQP